APPPRGHAQPARSQRPGSRPADGMEHEEGGEPRLPWDGGPARVPRWERSGPMNPMKREEGELARLRKAFASLAQPAPEPAACPPPEKLWEAVRGELPPA